MTLSLSQKYWIGGIAAALILVGLGYYVLHRGTPAKPSDTASTTTSGGVSIQTSGGGNATVTEIPVTGSASAAPAEPSLNRPVTFSGSVLSADAQPTVAAAIASLSASLKKDPTQLELWVQLGIYRKMAGDYEGAAEAWVYVHELAPADEVSVADLGDLYANFIKDYPKAEMYYKEAISANSHVIDNYRNLYTLYRYSYKVGTGADTAIIAEGLKNNPGNQDLLTLQAQASQQ